MTSARFLLGITHVPPLYISTEICFVTSHALRHPQCVLINVHQVLKWTAINNGISIQFLDGTTLQVALSVSLFQKRIAQAEELQALLNCFYRKESVYTTV